ncbi:MAG: signal peptide peptidase SppA [Proteobacteria bacterium]|nr:signal peptide peptidase SppA [Pseudomonadota bacterium]
METLPQELVQTGLSGAAGPSFGELLRALQRAREEEEATGVFLRLGPFGGGWARALELRSGLQSIRGAKKPVHCHLTHADNLSYAVAAQACDRVTMTPSGMLELVGVSAQVVYLRRLLDSVGLRADGVQIGRFKGAADPLTRNSMPEETIETLGAILDSLQSQLIAALVEGRGLLAPKAQAIIDGGPYDASQARARGLIDDVEFDDEARAHAKAAAKAKRVAKVALTKDGGSMDWGALFKALLASEAPSKPEGSRLAVVYLTGAIGSDPNPGFPGTAAGPFVKHLRKLGDDDDVRAVVLRIDSPGGSALASDRMWHAVRRVAKRKPVIASVGDMAASGGYWVASAASTILADDTSLVGSIGVVGGKLVVAELAQRLGLNAVVLRRGSRADWVSPMRRFSPDERGALRSLLERTYQRFIGRVAAGRKLKHEEVLPAAEGRLMTGRVARKHKLVDERGGLSDALTLARAEGQLSETAPLDVWPPPKSLLQELSRYLHEPDARALPAELQKLAGDLLAPGMLAALVLQSETVAATLPYVLTLR